jgi:arginyl-tRNA synthetase
LAADPVSALEAALAVAAGAELELERPAEPEHGDYATNVALQLAGTQRRPPREIAAEIAEAAAGLDVVEKAEVAGPGFVNLFLRDEWFAGAVGAMIAPSGGPRRLGAASEPKERVQIEMVSANPTGPLHVAHGRNGAYGDAVARLFSYTGHTVEREYYYNDSGGQMDRFRASVDAVRNGQEPPEDGYRGAYIEDLAALKGDPVPLMLKEIEGSLERFHVHFDTFRRQSELEQRLPELLPRLDTYEKDGALWARSSAHGDDEDRVLLRSEDRTPTYRAADVAYLVDKLERGFDRAIYVLGADHHGTRNWYAAVARMLGYDPERVEVLLYQLVHLTRGGEQTKMSKRRGDVVFLDEFMDEIGVDAARWYLVNRGPDQTIEIDIDLAAERSQKNAVYYVQYGHARIAGILRNASDAAPSRKPGQPFASSTPNGPLTSDERELIKRLAELPGVVDDALAKRGPQAVPAYAIRVADDFHRFYHEHRVLESEQQAFRLALCMATQRVIATCLDLVGVEAPERM